MTPFVEAALQQLASRVRCPGCTVMNLDNCVPTLEINPKDWTVYCSVCSFKGPLGRFLINGAAL